MEIVFTFCDKCNPNRLLMNNGQGYIQWPFEIAEQDFVDWQNDDWQNDHTFAQKTTWKNEIHQNHRN